MDIDVYKAVVSALVESGVDVDTALSAAQKAISRPAEQVKKAEVKPVLNRKGKKKSGSLQTATDLALELGIKVSCFNDAAERAGLLRTFTVDVERLDGNSRAATTRLMTETGKQYGSQYITARYKDGSAAVYQHRWYRSVLPVIKKAIN